MSNDIKSGFAYHDAIIKRSEQGHIQAIDPAAPANEIQAPPHDNLRQVQDVVDRRALPIPESRPKDAGEYVAPSTELESALAGIWGEVLRVEQVGEQDNFFDLGGDSLLAIRLIARIRERLQIQLPVAAVFLCPTIHKMARLHERLSSEDKRAPCSLEGKREVGTI